MKHKSLLAFYKFSVTEDMTHDMTKGNPLQLILRFTIPVFFGNLFQQVYNLADALIAGRYIGVNALAAIGSTGSLIFFLCLVG